MPGIGRVIVADECVFLVLSNPTEGREDEYNEWYEQVHLPDVLAVPGVAAAQRYRLATMPEDSPIPKPAHQYLAVYQLDGDPADVMQQFLERVGSGKMVLSESLDLATVSMHHWVPCGARQHASTGGA
jgi:hypothetical protein